MALKVADLFATLRLDSSDFDSGMNNAQGTIQKSGGILSNALSFATGGAILSGLSAVKDKVLDIGKSMIGGNAEFETYTTQFGVLLGSTTAAKDRLADLAKFGASTPFELPELVRADKVLQSFGIHSQEMLTTVGDVAAGTGTSFEDMALLMGKFSAGATGEAISRFAELGIASRKELADLGLQFSKSGELLTPLPEAMTVVNQLMKDKFGGMMDAQSQTFDGMVSNLSDWKETTLRTLGAPIFEVVKDKLGVLLEFINRPEVQAGIATFAQSLATGIGNTITFISDTVIPAFLAAWNFISPTIGAVVPIIAAVVASFATGGSSANQLGSLINTLGATWVALQPVINSVVNIVRDVVLTGFGIVQTFIQAHSTQINTIISTTWQIIQVLINAAMVAITNYIIPALTTIAAFIAAHSDTIKAIFQGVWTVIQGIVQVAISIVQGVLKTTLALITGDWDGAWNAIKAMFSGVWDGIKTIVSGAITVIKSELSLAWSAVSEAATSVWNRIRDSISTSVGNIKTSIITNISNAVDYVEGLPGRMYNAGSAMIENLRSGIQDKINGMLDYVRRKLKELSDLMPGSEPKDTTSPLYNLGRRGAALVTNFQAGIESASASLRSSVTQAITPISNSTNQTTNIYANYATNQSSDSFANDVGLLQAMYGGI